MPVIPAPITTTDGFLKPDVVICSLIRYVSNFVLLREHGSVLHN
ncbi:hypothetical protein [Leptospira biflexa]|nr:hypothetical protein [Leptospira biflexa]